MVTGRVWFEGDFFCEKFLDAYEVVVLDTEFQGGFGKVVGLIAVETLFDCKHVNQLLLHPDELI